MKNRLEWLEPIAYCALRIVAGSMFLTHGAQKIFGWFSPKAIPAALSQLWFGGLIELVGGALIALGLFTRPAAFVCAGTMAVAYFQFHWKLQVAANKWVPLVNQGEMAVLYCFVFLLIFARGPGPVSLDRLLRRR